MNLSAQPPRSAKDNYRERPTHRSTGLARLTPVPGLNRGILFFFVVLLLAGCAPTSLSRQMPSEDEAFPVEVIASGIFDAENLAFDAQGRLFVSAADRLYMIEKNGRTTNGFHVRAILPLEAVFAGMAVGPDGCLYVVCYHQWKTKILRVDVSRPGFPYSIYLEGTIRSPNGLRFDDDGTLYVVDFGFYMPRGGAIWRIERDPDNPAQAGRATRIISGPWGPNGVVMDRDRNRIYFTGTLTGKIFYLDKADLEEEDPKPRLLINVRMPGPRFPILDDLALDVDGNLYVCHYNGNQILVISPEGELLRRIKPPGLAHPTALAFGVTREDATSLYVSQKGQMLLREERKGDRVSLIRGVASPYRLPFLDLE